MTTQKTAVRAIALGDNEVTYRGFKVRIAGSDAVKLFIRALTPEENRDLRERHMRASRKLKSLRNETVGQWERKLEAIAQEKGSLALKGSEDFAIALAPDKRQPFTDATGVSFDDAGVALLPAEWSQGLKTAIFAKLPAILDFVCEKTDEMSRVEGEEEDDETASFR
jgi:hypothetical protein